MFTDPLVKHLMAGMDWLHELVLRLLPWFMPVLVHRALIDRDRIQPE